MPEENECEMTSFQNKLVYQSRRQRHQGNYVVNEHWNPSLVQGDGSDGIIEKIAQREANQYFVNCRH